MRAIIALLVVACLPMASPILAAADEPRHEIHLSTHEIMRAIEALPERHPMAVERYIDEVVHYLKTEAVGIGPLFTLLPAERRQITTIEQIEPPRFAFVARAGGRTLVSLTKIGSTADPEDRVLHQRWLISDLLKGRQYSLTVYKEHTLDKDALHFLGVGARLKLRPDLKFAGWRFGFEMYGSYHPDHQATAYLALTGKTLSPAPVALPGSAERAARRHGALLPVRW